MWDMILIPNTDNGGNRNGKVDIKNVELDVLWELDNMLLSLPPEQFATVARLHQQIEYFATHGI
jgi:hypothetical protein